jgi:uncharacterized protein YcgI (DUF1989 family)
VTFTARQVALLRAAHAREAHDETLEEYVVRASLAPPRAPSAALAAPAIPTGSPAGVTQGQSACVELRKGDRVRIEQATGGQCADVLAWGSTDRRERLSASVTRVREGASPTVGALLWSEWPFERPLLTITADSAPGHDLLHPACTPGEYERIGAPAEPACALVQAEAARACGIEDSALPDPLNLWFRPTLDGDAHIGWKPTPTRVGDHVELLALEDVLVLVNPCVDDVFGCSTVPGGALLVSCTPPDVPIRLTGMAVETCELILSLDENSTGLQRNALPHEQAHAIRSAAVQHALEITRPREALPR